MDSTSLLYDLYDKLGIIKMNLVSALEKGYNKGFLTETEKNDLDNKTIVELVALLLRDICA